MESAILYAIFYISIGALLLLFGAKFIRLAVGLIGGLIGFNIGHTLFYHLSMTGWIETTLTIVFAIVVAMIAISFYKLFITLSISYTAGSLTYSILRMLDAEVMIAIALAVLAGIMIFFVIRAMDLVEALFALVTSTQGASAIIAGILLLTDKSLVSSLQHGNTALINETDYFWILVWVALVVFGMIFQLGNSKNSK